MDEMKVENESKSGKYNGKYYNNRNRPYNN